MNILFYGNCQCGALNLILNFNSKLNNVVYIPCHRTTISEQQFKKIINDSDIIITQPIKDNYRNLNHLSTSFITLNKKKECKLIIFNSIYFSFYYFDQTYIHLKEQVLHYPADYHNNYMIDYYKQKKSINEYISDIVNNIDLVEKEELIKIAQNNIEELVKRYQEIKNKLIDQMKIPNTFVLNVHDFIEKNYKNQLLFYSINHPSKFVFHHLVNQILDLLQDQMSKDSYNINYNLDPLVSYKSILYRSLSKVVDFDLDQHKCWILNTNDIEKIIKSYYDTYEKMDLFK
jgi:hypothetical protein